jgi:hypothetical protein
MWTWKLLSRAFGAAILNYTVTREPGIEIIITLRDREKIAISKKYFGIPTIPLLIPVKRNPSQGAFPDL